MRKPCPKCLRGWISKHQKCPNCFDGYLAQFDANGNTYRFPCPDCKGSSRKEYLSRCPNCSGTGYIDVPD